MAIILKSEGEPVNPNEVILDASQIKNSLRGSTPIITPSRGQDDYAMGYVPTSVDIEQRMADINRYKSTVQSDWEKAANVFKRGVPMALISMIEPFAAVGDLEQIFTDVNQTEEKYGNWLSQWLREATATIQEAAPIYTYDEAPSLGSFDWFYKNGDQIIKSMGYFVPGLAFTKAFASILRTGAAAITGGQLSSGAIRGVNVLGTIGSATVNNYSEHMLSAMEIFEQRKQDWYNEFVKDIPKFGITVEETEELKKKAYDRAKIKASEDAEEVIAKGKWNIALNTIEYLSLFKGVSGVRNAITTSRWTRAGKGLLTATSEAWEEGNTNFFEDEALRNFDIYTGKADEGDSSTTDRYFRNMTEYDTQTEMLAGFLGGGGMQFVSEISEYKARQAIRKANAETGKVFSDSKLYNKLVNTNNLLDFFVKNAAAGTFDKVEEGLNTIANMSEEEATKFGLRKDYKEVATEQLELMTDFENNFNALSEEHKDSKNQHAIYALTTALFNKKASEKELVKLYADLAELSKTAPKDSEPKVEEIKDLVAVIGATSQQIHLAEQEYNSMKDDLNVNLNTNETKSQLKERLDLLRAEQQEAIKSYNLKRKEFITEQINKDAEISDKVIQKILDEEESLKKDIDAYNKDIDDVNIKRNDLLDEVTSIAATIAEENAKPKEKKQENKIEELTKRKDKTHVKVQELATKIEEIEIKKKELEKRDANLSKRMPTLQKRREKRTEELEKSINDRVGELVPVVDPETNEITSTQIKYSNDYDTKRLEILQDVKFHESRVKSQSRFVETMRTKDGIKKYNESAKNYIVDKSQQEEKEFNTKLNEVATINDLNKLKLKYSGKKYASAINKKLKELQQKEKVVTDEAKRKTGKTPANTSEPIVEQAAEVSVEDVEANRVANELAELRKKSESKTTPKDDVTEDITEDKAPPKPEDLPIEKESGDKVATATPKDDFNTSFKKRIDSLNNDDFIAEIKGQTHQPNRLDGEEISWDGKIYNAEFINSIPNEYIDNIEHIQKRLSAINTDESLILIDLLNNYKSLREFNVNPSAELQTQIANDGVINNDLQATLEDDGFNSTNRFLHKSVSVFHSINFEKFKDERGYGRIDDETGEQLIVERGKKGQLNVGLKIVDGAIAFAYSSRESKKVYFPDGTFVQVDGAAEKNPNLVEILETSKFKDGTKLVISIDTQNEDYNRVTKEYKADSNEFIDSVPMKIEAEINGKRTILAYIHTLDWIEKSVAPIIFVNGVAVDNIEIQKEAVQEIRRYIYGLSKSNKSFNSTVTGRSIGHPIINNKVDAKGELLFKKSGEGKGRPQVKKDSVSKLLPSVTTLAVSKAGSFYSKKAKIVEMTDGKKHNIPDGMIVAVVTAANGQTTLLPVFSPKIAGNNVISTSLNTLIYAFFNEDTSLLSNLVDENGEPMFDRNVTITLKSFLEKYIYISNYVDANSDTANVGFNKEGQFYFSRGNDGVIYTAKKNKNNNSYQFYKSFYDETGKLIETKAANLDGSPITLDQFTGAFNDALSTLRFSTKLANLNQSGEYIETIFTRKDNIPIVKEHKRHKNYNEYAKGMLETIFKEHTTSDGDIIYFEQPNIYFNIEEIENARPKKKQTIISETGAIPDIDLTVDLEETGEIETVEKLTDQPTGLDKVTFDIELEETGNIEEETTKTDETDLKSIATLEESIGEIDMVTTMEDLIIPEINDVAIQNDVIDTMLGHILTFVQKDSTNSDKISPIIQDINKVFNNSLKILNVINRELSKIEAPNKIEALATHLDSLINTIDESRDMMQLNQLRTYKLIRHHLTNFGITTEADLDSYISLYETILTPRVWTKLTNMLGARLDEIGLQNIDTIAETQELESQSEEDSVYERTKYNRFERLKINPKLSISGRLKLFLSGIPVYETVDGTQQLKLNSIGHPKIMTVDTTYSLLMGVLIDKAFNKGDIIRILQTQALVDKTYETIYNRLVESDEMMTDFINGFIKHRQSLGSIIKFYKRDDRGEIDFNETVVRFVLNNRKNSDSDIANMLMEYQINSNLVRNHAGIRSVNKELLEKLTTYYKKNFIPNNIKNNAKLLRVVFDKLGFTMIDDNMILELINNTKQSFGQSLDFALNLNKEKSFISGLLNSFKLNEQIDFESGNYSESILTENGKKTIISLARFIKSKTDLVVSLSAVNSTKDKIYEVQNHNRLSLLLDRLKANDEVLIDRLLAVPFSSRSLLINDIKKGNFDHNKLNVSYFDTLTNNLTSKVGKQRKEYNKTENDEMAILLFQSSRKIDASSAMYVGLTFGDSDITPILTLQRHNVGLKFDDNDDFDLSNDTKNKLYIAAQSEIGRVLSNLADVGTPNYNKNRSEFIIFRELSENGILALEKRGLMPSGTSAKLYEDGVFTFIEGDVAKRRVIGEILAASFKDKIKRFHQNLINNKLITIDKNGNHRTKLISDDSYRSHIKLNVGSTTKTVYGTEKTEINTKQMGIFIAADYYINNAIASLEQYILLANDPIIYSKIFGNGDLNYDATLIHLQKRLKGILSPFIIGNHPRSSYRRLYAKDLEMQSNQLDMYIKKYDPSGYTKITLTDAQEFITFREALDFKYAYGEVNKKTYERLLKEYNASKKAGTMFVLSDKDLVLFQPDKPMSFEDIFDGNQRHTSYTKSSAFVLLPQFTTGLELDKLRQMMEDETNSIDRVSFGSADKLAHIPSATLFDNKTGKFVATNESIKNSIATIDREMSGKQQHIPTGKETVVHSSQMGLLLFNNIREVSGFIYKGEVYNGAALEKEKEKIKAELFELSAKKIHEAFGYNKETGEISNIESIQKILLSEAKSRNWGIADIQQLLLANPLEFEVPLLLNNSFDAIQYVLTSYMNKVVRPKIHGKGYIQGSSAGFTTLKDVKTGTEGMIFSDSFTGELKSIRIDEETGQILPAQILVAWNFRDSKGELLDIRNYYKYNEDGTTILNSNGSPTIDFEKLPQEVLRGIGFRIPNQSHSSMIPFEIVGFLPSQMADLAIVPADLINQMGSDFDIDKLYSYLNQYYVDLDGKLNKLSRESKLFTEKEKYLTELDKIITSLSEEMKDGKKLQTEYNTAVIDKNEEKLKQIEDRSQKLSDAKSSKAILNAFTEENLLKQDYVDIHWSVLTNPAVTNLIVKKLEMEDLALEYAEIKTDQENDILDWQYQRDSYMSQQAGADLIAINAVANVFNSVIQPLNLYLTKYESQGKRMVQSRTGIVFHAESGKKLYLTNLSGNGRSVYNSKTRTKSDVINILLNAAVDNSNNPLLGNTNITKDTINIAILMALLETESAESIGIDYIVRFLNQPIIKDYISNLNQLLAEGVPYTSAEILAESLATESFSDESISDYNNNKAAYLNNNKLNPTTLLEQIKAEQPNEVYQLGVLDTFKRLKGFSETLNQVQSNAIFPIRNGAGASIYETISKSVKIEALDKIKTIAGVDAILKNEEHASAKKNTLDLNNDITGTLLSLNTGIMNAIMSTIDSENNNKLTSEDTKEMITGVRRYLTSGNKETFDNSSLQGRRKELLFGSEKEEALGIRLDRAKIETPNNFLKSLSVTSSTRKGETAYFISFSDINSLGISETKIMADFLELLRSNTLENKKLAQDLVEYAYIFGTTSSAFNYIKYIPMEYMKGLGVNAKLRTAVKDIRSANQYYITKQIIQHNPNLTTTIELDGDRTRLINGSNENPLAIGSKIERRFVTILDTNFKPMLFENIGYNETVDGEKIHNYIRINTLGNALKGKNVGQVFEYNNEGNSLSILPQNNTIYTNILPSVTFPTKMPNGHLIINDIQKLNGLDTKRYLGILTPKDITNSNELLESISSINPQYSMEINPILKKLIPNIKVVENKHLIGSEATITRNDTTREFTKLEIKDYNSPSAMRIGYHELIHSAIANKISDYKDHLEGKSTNLTAIELSILGNLFNTYNNILNKVKENDEYAKIIADIIEKSSKNKAIPSTNRFLYGFSDIQEFVAEVLTNVEFQKLLNGITYEDETALDAVLKYISKLITNIAKSLGIEVKNDSALYAAIRDTLNLMNYYSNQEDYTSIAPTLEYNVVNENTKTKIELQPKQLDLFDETTTEKTKSPISIKVEQYEITITPDGRMYYKNGNEVLDETTKNKVLVKQQYDIDRIVTYNNSKYFVLEDNRIISLSETSKGKEVYKTGVERNKVLKLLPIIEKNNGEDKILDSTDTGGEILNSRRTKINYTSDQRKALLLVEKFIKSDDNFFLLAGFAGTGKTTIAENIATFSDAIMLAPTNAAVKRLRQKFQTEDNKSKFSTIHKLLYGSPDSITGEWVKKGLNADTVYIIDESSMIDVVILDDLLYEAKNKNSKLIFLGDSFQLEPVGNDPKLFKWNKEEFKRENQYELKEVKRQEGDILLVATDLRVNKGEIYNPNSKQFKVIKSFGQELIDTIKNNEEYVVLVATNKDKISYNNKIRKVRFEDDAKNVINEGEVLLSVANNIFTNSDIYTVKNPIVLNTYRETINVGTTQYPKMLTLEAALIEHTALIDDIEVQTMTLLFPNLPIPSLHGAQLLSNSIFGDYPFINELDNGKVVWNKAINIATYGYSITTHKSQGNEWNNVFIDVDWLSDSWDKNRWIYTAITRAKSKVRIKTDKFKFKDTFSINTVEDTTTDLKSIESIKEGVPELFESNPELASIGNQQLYSQYLDTIFPDSKVKDIFHHWAIGSQISDSFGNDLDRVKGIWLSKDPNHWKDIIRNKSKRLNVNEIKGYYLIINSKKVWVSAILETPIKGEFPDGYDTIVAYDEAPNNYSGDVKPEFKNIDDFEAVIKSKEQIHILGTEQDIEGFKNYINKTENQLDLFDDNQELKSPTIVSDETLYQIPSNVDKNEYVASEKTIRDLAARMSDRIGIRVRFESDRTKEYKGKLENDTAIINLAHATLDTPIHEILGHPIIRAIKTLSNNKKLQFEKDKLAENWEGFSKEEELEFKKQLENFPTLYQNLLKELETGKGKEVLDRIKRDYVYKLSISDITVDSKHKGFYNDNFFYYISDDIYYKITTNTDTWNINDFIYILQHSIVIDKSEYNDNLSKRTIKYSLEEQQEEALVELLGLMTAGKLDKIKDGSLISLLKQLLKEISDYVKSLITSKDINISELSDNLTLGDIANILAYSNSKIILPGNEVVYTTPDNQVFKTYIEASNYISRLAKSTKNIDLGNVKIITFEDYRKDKKVINNLELKHGKFLVKKNLFGKEIVYFQGNKPKEYPFEVNDNFIKGWLNNANYLDDELKSFIEKNKEYEQSKEIIEEWKKVNNIQYNPEEVYSRGQGFYSVVGAYSNYDINLIFQNLLHHIEDNQKAGGEFTISAFTKPINTRLKHIESTGGKVRFVIYPKSEDIKWASNQDVYSGSVWDAGEKVNKEKQSELLGVSYTKYPAITNINGVAVNLASIIDNMTNSHNELGITLTDNNFRLEYDDDVPTSTKKLIDANNKILDEKYGKITKPTIKEVGKVQYNVIDLNGDILSTHNSFVEARSNANTIENNSNGFIYGLTISKNVDGIKPSQTNETLKESITKIYNRIKGFNSRKDADDFVNLVGGEPIPDNQINNREYTSQALINTKIAKLKEAAKKYPRSLIRSEVININNFDSSFQKPSKSISVALTREGETISDILPELEDYMDSNIGLSLSTVESAMMKEQERNDLINKCK